MTTVAKRPGVKVGVDFSFPLLERCREHFKKRACETSKPKQNVYCYNWWLRNMAVALSYA